MAVLVGQQGRQLRKVAGPAEFFLGVGRKGAQFRAHSRQMQRFEEKGAHDFRQGAKHLAVEGIVQHRGGKNAQALLFGGFPAGEVERPQLDETFGVAQIKIFAQKVHGAPELSEHPIAAAEFGAQRGQMQFALHGFAIQREGVLAHRFAGDQLADGQNDGPAFALVSPLAPRQPEPFPALQRRRRVETGKSRRDAGRFSGMEHRLVRARRDGADRRRQDPQGVFLVAVRLAVERKQIFPFEIDLHCASPAFSFIRLL